GKPRVGTTIARCRPLSSIGGVSEHPSEPPRRNVAPANAGARSEPNGPKRFCWKRLAVATATSSHPLSLPPCGRRVGRSGGRIGRADAVHAPGGAAVRQVDYGDATILPGLVDAHTHLVAPGDGTLGDDIAREEDHLLLLQAAKNARTLLHSGVTTLRENGAKGKVAFSLREGVRRQLAPGPRMVICGRPIAITGGHMGYFGSEADGEAAVRAEVRKLLKE